MRTHPSLRRTGPILLLALATACSAVDVPTTPPAGGPGTGTDAARQRAAAAVFLDAMQPKAARLAAARQLEYGDDETFADLLAVGTDRSQDDEIRWAAMRRHRFDGRYINAVIAILQDPADGGTQFNADLVHDLGRRSLRIPAEFTQKITAALRDLLDDPRLPVRVAAYNVLVAAQDTVALSRLTDLLRAGGDAVPIPATNAIRLLYLDGSIFHLEVLRPYLGHEETAVRAEAARALAVDPDSRPHIVEMTVDPETAREIRLFALPALARNDEEFADYAIPMVANTQDDPVVRYEAMKAFVGRMNYSEVDPRTQIRFAQVVERVAGEAGPPAGDGAFLRREAKRLLAYLKKAFPAIARHYALR